MECDNTGEQLHRPRVDPDQETAIIEPMSVISYQHVDVAEFWSWRNEDVEWYFGIHYNDICIDPPSQSASLLRIVER